MKMLKRWISVCLVILLLAGVAFDHSSLIGSTVEAADVTETGEMEDAAAAEATALTTEPAADTPSVLSETGTETPAAETPEEQPAAEVPAEQPAAPVESTPESVPAADTPSSESAAAGQNTADTPAASDEEKKEESELKPEIAEEDNMLTGKKEEAEDAQEEELNSLNFENDDVTITVSEVEAGAIPEGAELKVVPILADDKDTEDQYKEVEEQIQKKAKEDEKEIKGFLAYDITFVDADGNEVEPNSEVKVTMEYKEPALPAWKTTMEIQDTEVSVLHLEEDEDGNVKEVVDMDEAGQMDALETGNEQQVQKVEVRTESFSTFAIYWGSHNGKKVTAHIVDTDGKDISGKISQGLVPQDRYLEYQEWIDMKSFVENMSIAGYTFKEVRCNSIGHSGVAVKSLYVDNEDGISYFNWKKDNDHKFSLGNDIYYVYSENSELTTVKTVDSKSKGVTMKMVNFPIQQFGGATWTDSTNGRNVKPGILNKKLGSDGYPTINSNNNYGVSTDVSFSELFGDATSANNLFLESVYNQTGRYFYYNSEENAASLGADGIFKVYNQLSTPSDTDNFIYQRGNFLPYNTFNQTLKSINTNEYDASGKQLLPSNPRYDETLLLPDGMETDFYFGMELSADFIQTKSGYYDGQPIRYDFTGDDDLWVFIDGVLVLDMGGCHDARSGYIDFSTGKVHVEQQGSGSTTDIGETTTLYELFRLAGYNEEQLNNTFYQDEKGNYLFKNYTKHTFKMWYMERGAGASNLKIKFNLPVIPDQTIEVEKQVVNNQGVEVNYAEDIDFEFNLKVNNSNYANKPYTIWEDGNQTGQGTTDNDGNFTLKHGQIARFSGIAENSNYQVTELGAYLEGYKIFINDTQVYDPGTGTITPSASSGELNAGATPHVEFRNEVQNTGTLTITKKIADGSESLNDETFSIQVKINGKLFNQTYMVGNDTNKAEDGIVTLSKDQTATITGIPYGSSIEIEEVAGSTYYAKYELTGDCYDSTVPEYDQNGFVNNDVPNKISTKLAGNCEVSIENSEVIAGTTNVEVTKEWDGVNAEEQSPVTITLYSGEEGEGSPVGGGVTNPITLSSENSWKYEWTNLPGDTNYYVVETVGEEFEYETSYTYEYKVNSDFDSVKPCNDTYYPLGANGVIAVFGGSNWLIWTSEEVKDAAQDNLIDALNSVQGLGGKKISENNSTFIYGTASGQLQSQSIHFEYENGNVLLDFDKSSNWSFFGIGTFTKNVTATVTNSINENATIDIPVEKVWVGNPEDYQYYNNVTVELYKNNQKTEKQLVIEASEEWKDKFTDLPYYTIDQDGNYTVNQYSVKEIKVNDLDINNLDSIIVSITGDAENGFTITNTIPSAWYIRKVSSTDKHPLTGATFTLTREGEEKPCYYGKSLGTEESGRIHWWDDQNKIDDLQYELGYIPDGVYILEETKAPDGYRKSEEKWTIIIENLQLISIVNDKGNAIEKEISSTFALVNYDVYQFKNDAVFALPQSGGPGIYWYTIGGMLLMMAGSLILYKNKRREVLERK